MKGGVAAVCPRRRSHHHHHLDAFFMSRIIVVLNPAPPCWKLLEIFTGWCFPLKDFPSARSAHSAGVVGNDLDIFMFEVEAVSLHHVLRPLFLIFSELRYFYWYHVSCSYCPYAFLCCVRQK
jgi:hypothetical protein